MTPKLTSQVLDTDAVSLCEAMPATEDEDTETAPWLGDDLPRDERVGLEPVGGLLEPLEPPTDIQADRLLVDRCLAGEPAAWEELYGQYHALLCASIGLLLPRSCDPNVIDEIAARVWYALVANDGRLLGRFDPSRHVRLSTFFRGLPRVHILLYFRDENCHHAQVTEAGRRRRHNIPVSELPDDVMLSDFADTLTADDRRFLEEYLLSSDGECADADDLERTDAGIWQRRHRLMAKLRAFFASP